MDKVHKDKVANMYKDMVHKANKEKLGKVGKDKDMDKMEKVEF